MYDLYRFMSKERAESFLKGNLYLSALGTFWPPFPGTRDEDGEPSGRYDSFEGTAFAQKPENSPLPEDLQVVMKTDLHFMLDSSQYVNLLCMVQHFYNPYNETMKRIDARMRGWGDFAVRVFDVGVFLGRLQDYAMSRGDDYFLAGPVEYLDSFSDKQNNDCFDKASAYAYQHEWRVAYLADLEGKKEIVRAQKHDIGPYNTALQFSLGPLDDIADIIPSEVVFNDLESAYNGLKVVDDDEFIPTPEPTEPSSAAFYDGMYFGWGERSSFRAMVASIDGGRISGRFAL